MKSHFNQNSQQEVRIIQNNKTLNYSYILAILANVAKILWPLRVPAPYL